MIRMTVVATLLVLGTSLISRADIYNDHLVQLKTNVSEIKALQKKAQQLQGQYNILLAEIREKKSLRLSTADFLAIANQSRVKTKDHCLLEASISPSKTNSSVQILKTRITKTEKHENSETKKWSDSEVNIRHAISGETENLTISLEDQDDPSKGTWICAGTCIKGTHPNDDEISILIDEAGNITSILSLKGYPKKVSYYCD